MIDIRNRKYLIGNDETTNYWKDAREGKFQNKQGKGVFNRTRCVSHTGRTFSPSLILDDFTVFAVTVVICEKISC